jgi:type IV pilus assembly protein PilA
MKAFSALLGLTASDERGFSLVEIMTAVGIIGVLTAIAIPNYKSYIMNAHRQEAKIGLSSLYIAESTHQNQFKSYTSCLSHAGYIPDGASRFYALGFASAASSGATCGGLTATTPGGTSLVRGMVVCNLYSPGSSLRDGLPACATGGLAGTGNTVLSTYENQYDATQRKDSGTAYAANSDFAGTGLGLAGFSAKAVGNIGSSGTAIDVWMIDQTKTLTQTINAN